MKTTIDNDSRVFQIVDSYQRSTFCNLQDIEKVVESQNLKSGYYTIYHFWNAKPKKVSKKYLKEMLQANGLEQNFFY